MKKQFMTADERQAHDANINRLRTEYEERLDAEKPRMVKGSAMSGGNSEPEIRPEIPPESGKPLNNKNGQIDRSAAGLRNYLFDVLEQLRDGKIEPKTAAVAATVSQAILKSVDIQLDFEKLKLDSKVPMNMSDMKFVPPVAMLPSGVSK